MSARATFLRWLATFLAFPIGSLLAVTVVGSVDGPVPAAIGGAIAGAVLGAAQWLALRPGGLSPWWIAVTSAALAVGTAAGVAVTGGGTSPAALTALGAIAGATVGLAQGLFQAARGHSLAAAGLWTIAVAATWALGWLITSRVIIDAERGYVTFGSSGAIVATALTGLVVRRLILAPQSDRMAATASAAVTS